MRITPRDGHCWVSQRTLKDKKTKEGAHLVIQPQFWYLASFVIFWMWVYITIKTLSFPKTVFTSFLENFSSSCCPDLIECTNHPSYLRNIFEFSDLLLWGSRLPRLNHARPKLKEEKQTGPQLFFLLEVTLGIFEQAWFLLQTQIKVLIRSFRLSFWLSIVREYKDFFGTQLMTYPRCPRKCRTGNSWQAQLVVNSSSWNYLSWWHCCHVLECFVLCCLIL